MYAVLINQIADILHFNENASRTVAVLFYHYYYWRNLQKYNVTNA